MGLARGGGSVFVLAERWDARVQGVVRESLTVCAALAAITTLVLVFAVSELMFRAQMVAPGGPYTRYAGFIALRIFTGVARAAYVLLAVVLGLGGFVRERVHGTLGFTLPMPRRHHASARAGGGALELFGLTLVPCCWFPCAHLWSARRVGGRP